jgi:hypothetical protein
MSFTHSVSETKARELAGKVASDLRQFARFYGEPESARVLDYLDELEAFLEAGYVHKYKFGFKRNGSWILCYEYTVRAGELVGGRPGGIEPGIDVSRADFYNYLYHSDDWSHLPKADRDAFESKLPVQRTPALDPSHSGGVWYESRTYGAGGTELARRFFRA